MRDQHRTDAQVGEVAATAEATMPPTTTVPVCLVVHDCRHDRGGAGLASPRLERRRLHELGRVLTRLARPAETVRQVRRGWPAAREAFAEARAPRTSLNRRIGSHRRLALLRGDLGLVKRIAHGHDESIRLRERMA